ncbi:glycosyltransferase family 2 protein [Neobacillus drentensis]|uniref:glycosyltransferase family 2 protein n=1 Tax=Neobacillus drentensis TaxID=220684 RepID=UPI0028653C76|nr:glycosyltransferase [Neobacillus drentensis]MDR7240811.1 glycosyltransferase involved in cell wall biosynthesis [Neobacillus drentensis]
MISVVVCTNRQGFVSKIIENFQRQTLMEKELIIVANSTIMELKGVGYPILQFPEEISLGACLNKGVRLAKYDFVTKMDDDDYYGPNYLKEVYESLVQTDADVVGKSSFYIYFQKNEELRLYNPHRENQWIVNNGPYKSSYFLSGATLAFKKKIFKQVSFPKVNVGEDSGFQRLCYDCGLKMFSISQDHYAYLRYNDRQHHHSDAREPLLKRRSRFIVNTALIEKYVNNTK